MDARKGPVRMKEPMRLRFVELKCIRRRSGNTGLMEVLMNNMTLYGTNPLDLIDQIFYGDELLSSQHRTPVIDILDEDGRYLIEAELPGLSEKDVRLEVKDATLFLSTAKSEAKDEKKANGRWLRRERREFQFSRSFALPEDVDAEKIEATFRDGLLSVNLPKKPESSPRIVPVLAA